MYVYGTQFWSVVIADSFVSLTMAIVYLPVFYDLGITSSYEVTNASLLFSALSNYYPSASAVSRPEVQRCGSTHGFRDISRKNGKSSFSQTPPPAKHPTLQLLYIPLVIYVPALAFNQVTGINLHAIAILVCAVCIFYTTLVRRITTTTAASSRNDSSSSFSFSRVA